MRAAEILANLVLEEVPQGAVVIAHGPGLPAEGSYGTGPGWEEAMAKLLRTPIGRLIGTKPPIQEIIQVALHSGYTFFVKDLDGQIYFYGLQPSQLDQVGAQLLGVTANTQIQRIKRVGDQGTPEPVADFVGKGALGGAAKPRIQPKPALQRLQNKTKFQPPSPEEEKQFLSGVKPSAGLALTKGQPHSAEQIRQANVRDEPKLAAERAREIAQRQAELRQAARPRPRTQKPGPRQRFWRFGR